MIYSSALLDGWQPSSKALEFSAQLTQPLVALAEDCPLELLDVGGLRCRGFSVVSGFHGGCFVP